MPPKDIPERWEPYIPIGSPVRGTRFIAFKVPLKEHVCAKLPPKFRWTVDILCSSYPDIGMIIDLTLTTRYYDFNEVLNHGVDYCKIPLPGQKLPPESLVRKFFSAIDFYLDQRRDDSLIGVHCTHGVNRTGYMIARYLIQRMGYSVSDALESITVARGHPIERENYVSHLGHNTLEVAKMLDASDIRPGRPRGPPRAPQAEKGKLGGKRPAGNAFADKGKGNVKRHGPARGNFRDNDRGWNPPERNLNPWGPGQGPNTSSFGRANPGFRKPKRSEFVDDSELDRGSPGDWKEWKEKDRPHLSLPIHPAGPQFDEPPRFTTDKRRDFREDGPPGRHFPSHERFEPRRPAPLFQSGPPTHEIGGEDDGFAGGRSMEGHNLEERGFVPRGDHGRIKHRGHPGGYVDERWEREPSTQVPMNEIFHDLRHNSPGRRTPNHPGHFEAPERRMQHRFGHPDHRNSPPRGRPVSPPRRHFSQPRGQPMSPPRGRTRSPLRCRPMTPPRGHPMSPSRHTSTPPRSRPMSPRGRPMSPVRGRPLSLHRVRPVTPPSNNRMGRRMSPHHGPGMPPSRGPRMSPPRGPQMSPPRGPRISPPRGPRISPAHGSRISSPRGTRMSPPRYRISPRRQSPSYRRFPSGQRMSPPHGSRISPPPLQRAPASTESGMRMNPHQGSRIRMSPSHVLPERRSPPPRPPRVSPPRGLRRMTPPPGKRIPPHAQRISPPRGHKMVHTNEAGLPPRPKGRRMSPPRHRVTSPEQRPIAQILPPPPRNIPSTNPRARSPTRRRPCSMMDDIPNREVDLCERLDHLDERYGPEIEPFPLERSPPRQEIDHRQSMGRIRRSRSPVKRQGSPCGNIAAPKRRRPVSRKDMPPKGRGNVASNHDELEPRSDRQMSMHDGVRGYRSSQQRGRPVPPQQDIDFEDQGDGNWRGRRGHNQSGPGDGKFTDDEEQIDVPEDAEMFLVHEEVRHLLSPPHQSSPRRTNDYLNEREQRRSPCGRVVPRGEYSRQGSRRPVDRNFLGREFDEEAMGETRDDQEYREPQEDKGKRFAREDRYTVERQNFRSLHDSPQARSVQYEDYPMYSHRSRSPLPHVDDGIDHNVGWDDEEPVQDCRELLLQKRVTRSIGALSPTALDLIGPDDEVIVIEESSAENSRPSSRLRRPVAVKLRKSPSSTRSAKPIFGRLDEKKRPVFDRLEESDHRPLSDSRAGSNPVKPQAANPRTDRLGSRPGVARPGDTRGNRPGEKPSGNKPRGSPSRGARVPSNDLRRPPKTDQPARPTRVSRPPPKTSPVKARLGQRGRR